ncbi:MAG: nucleoside monophosphate kinase, partial [Bacteroidales bacterium]|nr:nucleoside monophosphate kinase [Bacteroidales bacterium]
QKVDKVLAISIPDEMVAERIAHRAQVENRPDDTKPEVIANRISTYHEKTEPVMGYYKGQDKFYEIDGVGTIEEIFNKLSAVIA